MEGGRAERCFTGGKEEEEEGGGEGEERGGEGGRGGGGGEGGGGGGEGRPGREPEGCGGPSLKRQTAPTVSHSHTQSAHSCSHQRSTQQKLSGSCDSLA